MKEDFEAKIKNFTGSLREDQDDAMKEAHLLEDIERTYPPGMPEVVAEIKNLRYDIHCLKISKDEDKEKL